MSPWGKGIIHSPPPGPNVNNMENQILDSSCKSVHDPLQATGGSSALDIPAPDSLVMDSAMGIYKVKTGIYGPLLSGSVGLHIGRSTRPPREFMST